MAVPSHLAGAGLERITVTVPPVSLARLCTAVERNRPAASAAAAAAGGAAARGGGAITPLMVTDSDRDDESSSCWAAAARGTGRKASPSPSSAGAGSGLVTAATTASEESPATNSSEKSNVTEAEDGEESSDLPILRALQCYLYEAFRIDARHLHVARAATAHAVVGTDGRIKPMTVEALPSLLEDVRRWCRRCGGGGGNDMMKI